MSEIHRSRFSLLQVRESAWAALLSGLLSDRILRQVEFQAAALEQTEAEGVKGAGLDAALRSGVPASSWLSRFLSSAAALRVKVTAVISPAFTPRSRSK